ncbi:MAG TPA: FAD-dependent oxidoreductase [Candidatus Obscuribacterales bacterium]
MEQWQTEVLVVGGGTGGAAAAIQAARRGARTIMATDGPWLGGMLTSAGVSAPDGNELLPWQTGLWGAFLRELRQRQPGGLDHSWVSFFTYEPRVGASIFADWARSLPCLTWKQLGPPRSVNKRGDRLCSVTFDQVCIQAQIIIDGTELGDLLSLGDVPHRWGWDWQPDWQEPSAPLAPNALTQRYPVQSPTWVVVMQDLGEGAIAPEIPPSPLASGNAFKTAWQGMDLSHWLNYGRLPGHRFMINWPNDGNDYGHDLQRLVGSEGDRQAYGQEALWHSQNLARYVQQVGGRRYGLASDSFPVQLGVLGGGAYALHPYYRESRRLQGLVTVTERDILPQTGHEAALLPVNAAGDITAIALGNYVNDHHYPGMTLPLAPKAMRWGGRWTGTPFALPYGCLIPAETDGLLVCDKNSSVSHMANGATRLQPVVLALGQAAGMAAALCVEQGIQPRDLAVRSLQEALLTDPLAPAAVVPLIHCCPSDPDWLDQQRAVLDRGDRLPPHGVPSASVPPTSPSYTGTFQRLGDQTYRFLGDDGVEGMTSLNLVTLDPYVDQQMQTYQSGDRLQIQGRINPAGNWLLADAIAPLNPTPHPKTS